VPDTSEVDCRRRPLPEEDVRSTSDRMKQRSSDKIKYKNITVFYPSVKSSEYDLPSLEMGYIVIYLFDT
jgi:hypothetical protein